MWPQAIEEVVSSRDGSPAWSSRTAAYKKLEPLIWRQLIAQGEQFMALLQTMADFDQLFVESAAETRKNEAMSGWIEMRETGGTEGGAETEQWTRYFGALQDNLFIFYENDRTLKPLDIVCPSLPASRPIATRRTASTSRRP